MAGDDGPEEFPQPFDAKRLEPAKKRKHSQSPTRNKSKHRDDSADMPSIDELPQPFDAKKLEPAKKRQRSRSPTGEAPRKLKRPGRGARFSQAESSSIRHRHEQREREAAEAAVTQAVLDQRGINDVVRQHYNAVPERGRDWRKTDSRIKGLRSFNNWVKSTLIQKFSPDEDYTPGAHERGHDLAGARDHQLLVLDIGCGKGGDLGKWQQAPQRVALYVGLDPADVSIDQARERYRNMSHRGGGGRGGRGGHRGGRHQHLYDARFFAKDCYGESIGDIDIIRQVGFDHSPMGRSGFDIVSMMFCMHYAFESEEKARMMLQNVSGALKKGGRFIGCIPNSDVIGERVVKFNDWLAKKQKAEAAKEKEAPPPKDEDKEDGEEKEEGEEGEAEETAEWGNDLYRVRFPGKTPADGIFRPPFGWKYSFFLDEAVEEVPEYVVPWPAFRAIAEDYNLELQYHQKFDEIWEAEKDDHILGPLSERMGVRERGRGPLLVSPEEMEVASFYLAFCFYKV
ncbi:guanine-N(7)-methyltransferase [Annulohypoxylon truncatum]|uniref:guanine-N(7)-methyltransferase n=1 Tax=Annulohypoxylon truncatum TaxID=327061 RepID=UPI00200849A8|nr:guanine-N(7)-methyltransferase [Annulohypoxylon truncatum]KAI1205473.1 guanine-N(7)-methyltransferase [Annulohypoxylon truncatum]